MAVAGPGSEADRALHAAIVALYATNPAAFLHQLELSRCRPLVAQLPHQSPLAEQAAQAIALAGRQGVLDDLRQFIQQQAEIRVQELHDAALIPRTRAPVPVVPADKEPRPAPVARAREEPRPAPVVPADEEPRPAPVASPGRRRSFAAPLWLLGIAVASTGLAVVTREVTIDLMYGMSRNVTALTLVCSLVVTSYATAIAHRRLRGSRTAVLGALSVASAFWIVIMIVELVVRSRTYHSTLREGIYQEFGGMYLLWPLTFLGGALLFLGLDRVRVPGQDRVARR